MSRRRERFQRRRRNKGQHVAFGDDSDDGVPLEDNDDRPTEAFLREAQVYMSEGKHAKACATLSSLLALHEVSVEGLLLRAQCFLEMSFHQLAVTDAKLACELQHHNPDADRKERAIGMHVLGQCLMAMDAHDAALKTFTHANRLDPHNKTFSSALARCIAVIESNNVADLEAQLNANRVSNGGHGDDGNAADGTSGDGEEPGADGGGEVGMSATPPTRQSRARSTALRGSRSQVSDLGRDSPLRVSALAPERGGGGRNAGLGRRSKNASKASLRRVRSSRSTLGAGSGASHADRAAASRLATARDLQTAPPPAGAPMLIGKPGDRFATTDAFRILGDDYVPSPHTFRHRHAVLKRGGGDDDDSGALDGRNRTRLRFGRRGAGEPSPRTSRGKRRKARDHSRKGRGSGRSGDWGTGDADADLEALLDRWSDEERAAGKRPDDRRRSTPVSATKGRKENRSPVYMVAPSRLGGLAAEGSAGKASSKRRRRGRGSSRNGVDGGEHQEIKLATARFASSASRGADGRLLRPTRHLGLHSFRQSVRSTVVPQLETLYASTLRLGDGKGSERLFLEALALANGDDDRAVVGGGGGGGSAGGGSLVAARKR